MFERFGEGARRVLVLAQEEAFQLGHDRIGTEHLLLGLLREDDGSAAQALSGLGVHYVDVRRRLGGAGTAETVRRSPPFTTRAKKVLELAVQESTQLGHDLVDGEHVLLGLVRSGDGEGARILVDLGLDLGRIRQAVFAVGDGPPAPVTRRRSSAARRDGPRCPTCRELLDGNVGYRVLPVHATDPPGASGTVDVMFVYCVRCGVLLAPVPTGDIGVDLGARYGTVAFARTEPTAGVHPSGRVIGAGVADDDVRWTLTAGGSDDDYSTMLRTEDEAGVIADGGMGGPKLWGSDLLHVYSGGSSERGPRGVVVRCHPSITRLVVSSADGSALTMVDCGEADGLRRFRGPVGRCLRGSRRSGSATYTPTGGTLPTTRTGTPNGPRRAERARSPAGGDWLADLDVRGPGVALTSHR